MKQYLFMCDDSSLALFKAMFPMIQYLEVQGMTGPEETVNVLVTPLEKNDGE